MDDDKAWSDFMFLDLLRGVANEDGREISSTLLQKMRDEMCVAVAEKYIQNMSDKHKKSYLKIRRQNG